MNKRLMIMAAAAIIITLGTVQAVMAQSNDKEMSIEESYLQESVEMMIIHENSRASSRDQKMIALEYIKSSIDKGSTNDEIRSTLEYLALEGTVNKSNQDRKPMDYPDVRRQAAKYLGSIKTKESKDALIKIVTNDGEPMVIQEALKSLGTVGLNDNNDVIYAAYWMAARNHNFKPPDDLVAITALDTLDKFCSKDKYMDADIIQLLRNISEGTYARPVKDRARLMLNNLRNYR